jgi:hypothetical protein
MVPSDLTPAEPGGDGPVPDAGSAGTAEPGGPEAVSQPYGQVPNYAQDAYGQSPAQQVPAPGEPTTDGYAAPQDPYTQVHAAPQNPYSQGQVASDQGAYGQTPSVGQNPYGPNPYSQGQPPADAYQAGAMAAGAYTQGAYSQGAQQAPSAGGYPQPGYAPGVYPQGAAPAGYPQPVQRAPMDPKKKKTIILVSALAAALVLLLVVGSVVVNVINSTQYGPEATVRTYLTAISQGKASQASKLVDPGVTENAGALLSDDVLGEAKALMKNARVGKVTTRGNSAFAEISYSVDGTAFDDVLELSKDGKQGVFFDKWKIDKPLLSAVYVYANQGTVVSVNGKDVDFGKDYERAAYPGAYEIGAPEGDFFEAETQTFVAGTGSKATYEAVELDLLPSEGLTTAVQEALNAHLDTCATSTTDDPENCGMYTGATYDFADEPVLKYTVEKYPVVTVDDSGAYFTTEGGKVTAVATGTLYGGGTGTESYSTDEDWALDGTIVIDGDKVTLEDIY